MSNDLDSISVEDPHGVPWAHAACFRSWRAGVLFREQIFTMDRRTFAAFTYEYSVGNRAARPRLHLELEDIEDSSDRKDGWRIIGPGMGDQARYTDVELPLMENGVEVGIVMAWKNHTSDLWGDVLWKNEGEEQEAYETRQGKWKIAALLADLRTKPAAGTVSLPDGAVVFGEPTSGAQSEDASTGPRMATAPGEGDGGVPWAS